MRPTARNRLAGRLAVLIAAAALPCAGGRGAMADDVTRTPWTTSRLVGTPDPPPPYATEPAFPALKFEHPVVMACAPDTGRLYVGEQAGRVYSLPNDTAVKAADLALDLPRHRPGMAALYGLAFHPKFAENRFVYLCYVTRDGRLDGTRVSQFTAGKGDAPRIDPATEVVLLTFPSGGHNGGCLAFGPDGFLYISTGDAEVPSPPDPRDTGQDLTDLLSSVLRIDVDRADPGRAYRVPPDNPFTKLPGARPEIWAYGFRNPWRMSFDRKKGDLWVGDVGWELWEMVDRVEKGGNYGWSIVEGHQPVRPNGKRGPTPILPPVVEHPHSEAASITGGYVYHGDRLRDLADVYVYGDFQSGTIWGLKHDGTGVIWRGRLAETGLQLVSFGEDRAGELYLLDYERTRRIHRLVPNPAARATNRAFPRKLSETGLFASTRDQRPAAGVLAYQINAPLWSDGAVAERWLALPGDAKVTFQERGSWRFPDGAVLARTVSVPSSQGLKPALTRVETQVLHREAGSWRPYSYVWDDAQTDATLAGPEGAVRPVEVGGKAAAPYRVVSRAECMLCHNPWVESKSTVFGRQSASPLAVSTGQLNREISHGGKADNQLSALARLGVFDRPPGHEPAELPRTADPYDDSADLGRRSRAYLQVNCAHCHQQNAGGSATIQLGDDVPPGEMRAVGVAPIQGTFGITDARIVSPGDPEGTVLLYRTAKLGGGRMPRIGSAVVDDRGVRLLGDWIAALPRAGGTPALPEDVRSSLKALHAPGSIDRLLTTTRGAFALARRVERGEVTGAARREAVSKGAAHINAEVRDLFERFLPESERVARLGDSFAPAAVLDLAGDPRRGREVFLNNPAARCKSCHRLEGEGEPLGPDLSKIGSKYPRADLLRHVNEPSLHVDPGFQTYVVATKSGTVQTGLLVSRSAQEVVLKDASNRTTRIPAGDVEQVAPQTQSLMPDRLLRDLTARQAADLIDYLNSLR